MADDFFVEGESEGGPVAGGTEGAELELHVAALVVDEIPDLAVELVAGVVEAGLPFCFEVAFVDNPSFEAGVVGARDVPCVVALETVVADEDVLESGSEAVADVEVAVGVGGWHDDGIGVGLGVGGGLEGIRRFPEGVDVWFELIGFVGFAELHRGYCSISGGSVVGGLGSLGVSKPITDSEKNKAERKL